MKFFFEYDSNPYLTLDEQRICFKIPKVIKELTFLNEKAK